MKITPVFLVFALASSACAAEWRGKCLVVARLWVDDTDINREMVAAGMAWVTPQYCTQDFCENWQAAETEARDAKKGLWTQPNPLSPWEWRREKRRR